MWPAVAAYLRGVPYSLPAPGPGGQQCGEGGINHPRVKTCRCLLPAQTCLADPLSSKRLPGNRSGMAEVIKYGIIRSPGFFSWLEQNLSGLLSGKPELLSEAVQESCRIKAGVVEKDENDQGLRAILNFGHTLGHAVESLTGYGVFNHGKRWGWAWSLHTAGRRPGLLPEKERNGSVF